MEGKNISASQKKYYWIIVLYLLVMVVTSVQSQGTRVGFYFRPCPRAEFIVRSTVESHFRSDPTVAPGLLRMHFHDCFVRGCDGSVLINGPNTEKTAPPNLGLRGYEVIDDAKSKLEDACPGVVSCADILALAARDAVVLTKGLTWAVPTGRRDGSISLASEALNLPGFTDSVDVQKQKFAAQGLTTQDLVTLVGGHTIGTAACQFFRYRLYNFTTTGNGADPTIDAAFLPQLRALCPQNGDGTRRVGLDTGSANKFDATFFTNLRNGRSILESDQKLWTDASTRTFVERFTGITGLLTFNAQFGKAMVKMSNIGVKTGTQGAHTIGTTACRLFSYRLYNFSTTTASGADPTINPSFVPTLRALCPQNGDADRRVDLDTGSAARFDTTFFANLRNGQGVLESDQMLWTDPSTRTVVERFLRVRGAQSLNFNVEFAKSMVKMSNIGLKTGTEGEIRRVCTAIN